MEMRIIKNILSRDEYIEITESLVKFLCGQVKKESAGHVFVVDAFFEF